MVATKVGTEAEEGKGELVAETVKVAADTVELAAERVELAAKEGELAAETVELAGEKGELAAEAVAETVAGKLDRTVELSTAGRDKEAIEGPKEAIEGPKEAIEGPKEAHEGPKEAPEGPKRAHEAPKGVHKGPSGPKEGPKRAVEGPKKGPKEAVAFGHLAVGEEAVRRQLIMFDILALCAAAGHMRTAATGGASLERQVETGVASSARQVETGGASSERQVAQRILFGEAAWEAKVAQCIFEEIKPMELPMSWYGPSTK
jgi:hypothetical protein